MTLFRDLRYSLRALRKTPAFTAGAIVTVAVTVGATTAIFSVVYGVLLRQLPYREVERVVWIWSDQTGRDRSPFNVPDFIDYRDSTRTLAGFAGFFAFSANLSDEAAAERVQGMRATGNLFDVIGAPARIGRLLRPDDERPGVEHVVVLAESFWLRRFGGDPFARGPPPSTRDRATPSAGGRLPAPTRLARPRVSVFQGGPLCDGAGTQGKGIPAQKRRLDAAGHFRRRMGSRG